MSDELERYAAALQESGRYRVLRRFECPGRYADADDSPLLRGVFLDVETSGIDARVHDLIELAMVPFEYSADGRVFTVGEPFSALQDPGYPVDPFITRLTGITNEDLQGKSIEPADVAGFLEGVGLVVAHNAAFDRPFFEKAFPSLTDFAWACSQVEVPWRNLGVEGRKLEYIAYRSGVFFDGHRAQVDCQVGVHILAQEWQGDGKTALAHLLERSREVKARLWATGSPFESKDLLKARGYRFDGTRKVWYRDDLTEKALAAEKEWLARNIYQQELARGTDVRIHVSRTGARERFRPVVPAGVPESLQVREVQASLF